LKSPIFLPAATSRKHERSIGHAGRDLVIDARGGDRPNSHTRHNLWWIDLHYSVTSRPGGDIFQALNPGTVFVIRRSDRGTKRAFG
jgi:hypothetical protein